MAPNEAGVDADLFLPLRYGRVVLRERMPRRFYCRARWQTGGVDSETQVFDLDFVDRDGRNLGGIREFTVKRAPREALLRGLGGDATRMLYSLGWRETPPPASARRRKRERHLAGGRVRRAGGRTAGFRRGRPDCRSPSTWRQTPRAGSGARRAGRRASSGAAPGDPKPKSRATEFAARLETEIGNVLGAVHTLLAAGGHNLAGGLWIVTERAVATEAGEPVDPVQAALWGLGPHHHRRATEPALQAGRPRRIRRRRALAGAACSAHPATSPNSHCDKESSWCRGCCRGRAAATSRYRARPTTSWRRPNAARSTTCG